MHPRHRLLTGQELRCECSPPQYCSTARDLLFARRFDWRINGHWLIWLGALLLVLALA